MSFLRKFSEGYGEAKTKTSVEKEDNIGPKTQLGEWWECSEEEFKDIMKEENSWGEKVTVGEEKSKYCRTPPQNIGKRKKKSCENST